MPRSLTQPPVHQTWFTQVRLQADERLMADNRLESTLLIWPNEMNVHGTLFGGIVTRTAIEMAYMTVAQVRKRRRASQPLCAACSVRSSGRALDSSGIHRSDFTARERKEYLRR